MVANMRLKILYVYNFCVPSTPYIFFRSLRHWGMRMLGINAKRLGPATSAHPTHEEIKSAVIRGVQVSFTTGINLGGDKFKWNVWGFTHSPPSLSCNSNVTSIFLDKAWTWNCDLACRST